MDPLFLNYYNQELLFMREQSKVFAQQHPKIAKRLGMKDMDVQDPYVERLLEGFAFMSARIQLKLSAEFPNFTKRLLDVIYPHFNSPTPAMGVVQMVPSIAEGDLTSGVPVPKGTMFSSRATNEGIPACHFSTGFDTTLWPIKIVKAQLTGVPPELVDLKRPLPAHLKVEGALRLTLASMSEMLPLNKIRGLEQLPVYLHGDDHVVSKLYEIVHTCAVGYTVLHSHWRHFNETIRVGGITPLGLEPEQSIFPETVDAMHGHHLLHTYFTNPDVLRFFCIEGLAASVEQANEQEMEIIILLSRYDKDLADVVNQENFLTNCISIINVYQTICDNVPFNHKDIEHHVQVSRRAPLDYEIYSLLSVKAEAIDGHENTVSPPQEFRPLYTTINADQGDYSAYYIINREFRIISENARMYGTRSPYVGTEVFISLVDPQENAYAPEYRTLSVRALVTNRDLPLLLVRHEDGDLISNSSVPIAAIHVLRNLSVPRLPLAQREPAWKLIQLLGFNFHPLLELNPAESSQAIRDLLMLFAHEDADMFRKQIQALIGMDFMPVTRRIPQVGPLVYARGTKVVLTINEEGFSGGSPFLFALVVERWLSKNIALNSFIELELKTVQRGLVYTWPIRMGSRSSV